LVDFETGKKTFDNFIDLSFYPEKILNRKVELITSQSLSKYSGHHIANEVEYVALGF
jgi:predicted nucleotidyltransferase